jgi:hypothetical protein
VRRGGFLLRLGRVNFEAVTQDVEELEGEAVALGELAGVEVAFVVRDRLAAEVLLDDRCGPLDGDDRVGLGHELAEVDELLELEGFVGEDEGVDSQDALVADLARTDLQRRCFFNDLVEGQEHLVVDHKSLAVADDLFHPNLLGLQVAVEALLKHFL